MAKVVVKTLDSEDEVKYVKLRVQGHSKLFGVPLESNANLSISKLQMILPKAMALIIECHSDITLLMPKNGYFNQPEEGWEKVLISVVLNEQTSNIRRIPRPAATTQSTASSTDAPAIEVVKEAQEEEAAKKAAAQQAAGSSHPAESRLSEATAQSTASSTDAPAAAAVEPDPWDFAESVDILPQLFNNFQELIASKKWQERKEALEGFLALATDNIRLDPKANYNEIVATLTKILSKDANINVCAVAAKCITQLAKGLRSKFANHAPSIIEVIFEKFKVKKDLLRDPLIEAIDAIYATTTIEAVSENVVTALEKPNPTIKIQTNQFLCRVFKALNAQTAPKKVIRTLTPLIAKCTGESDAEAREAAFSALGAIMKAIGKNDTMLMLGDVANDKTKMERIEKFYNQAVEEA
uniref:TOG domain-containing protein n=1 Tax=Panagrolaimus sp. PS1159 TaxID=55785 RepID=A0AC35FFU1_9BILA